MLNSSKFLQDPNKPVQVSVPVQLKAHMMIVDVKINGLEKNYKFAVDTGAVTVISHRIADDLKFTKENEFNVKDISGNKKEANFVTLDKMGIQGVEVGQLAAVVTDIDKMDTQIDGILGSNYFQFFNLDIDYQKQSIVISNSAPQTSPETLKIPFKKNMVYGFAPTAECFVDGVSFPCMIDTGDPGFFSVPSSKIKKLPAYKNNNFAESNGSLTTGLFGGKGNDTVVGVSLFEMNNMKISNLAMITNHSEDGIMTIGKDFLDDYKVSIDYRNEQLYLTPIPQSTKPSYPIYTFGFGFAKDDNETTRVNGIWENSINAPAGIEIGDEVISINNLQVNDLSMLRMMDLFLEEEQLHVTFKKYSGEIKQAIIKREDLTTRVTVNISPFDHSS
jgi:predicted aspartyl protease